MATFGPPLVVTSGIVDNAVTNAKMADDSVLAAEIGADQVGASEIAADSITNTEINSAAGIVDTKLDTIATAGKVSGAALTLLANTPAGAGVLPTANTPAVPQSFFVSLTNATGGLTGEGSTIYRYLNLPNAAVTVCYATFLIPSNATISSIQFLGAPATGEGNAVVFDFAFTATPNAAQVNDSATGQAFSVFGTTDQAGYATIPSTAYDGLTKGQPWHAKITRQGNDAGDTHTSGIRALGLLVNLS